MPNFEEHIKRAADRYVDGIERGGLQPSEKLAKAMVQRAREDYEIQSIGEQLDNMEATIKEHNLRMNEIKRSGARLRVWTCPPIILFFALLAWYCEKQTGGFNVAVGINILGSLAFLAMLVLGAIFDRPKNIEE